MSNEFCPASGKVKHATAAAAYRRIPRRGGRRERGKAYRCNMCHFWHTTASI